MITLLADAGNSRLKLGWVEVATGRREAAPLALPYGEAQAPLDWLSALPAPPARTLGVNVAGPDAARLLQGWLAQAGLPAPQWQIPRHATALLRNGYDEPARLGADRWAALLGLARHAGLTPDAAGRPLLLAIFGTATTIDALLPPDTRAEAGTRVGAGATAYRHLGGLILPGPDLMAQALHRGTAQLPLGRAAAPCAFPRDTAQAIADGLAAAQAGAVLRQWQALRAEAGAAPQVYVSGGAWPVVEAELQQALARAQRQAGAEAEPARELAGPVLDGLAWLAGAEQERE